MKFLKNSILGAAALLIAGVQTRALDFNYSFVNDAGFGTDPSAVVAGSILGLNEGWNFQQITVTLDSISDGDPNHFVPHNWFDYGTFDVVSGQIVSAAFSSYDGSL